MAYSVVSVIRHGPPCKTSIWVETKPKRGRIPRKEAKMVGSQRILLTVFLLVILLSRVSLLFSELSTRPCRLDFSFHGRMSLYATESTKMASRASQMEPSYNGHQASSLCNISQKGLLIHNNIAVKVTWICLIQLAQTVRKL